MTRHLSESECVDLAEDTLDPRRAAHVETCAPCREQADTLRVLLHDTRAVEVPEPSPLFWRHLSARVHDEIAAEPGAGRGAWRGVGIRGLGPLAAAAAVIVALVSGGLLVRGVRDGYAPAGLGAGSVAGTPGPAAPEARRSDMPDAENAEVWAVLTAAASSVEFDDAHDVGLHVRPAAIDHAVQNLTAAERTELGRLLQSELKRSSD